MNENNEDSGSRFESVQKNGNNESVIKLVIAIFLAVGFLFWIFKDLDSSSESELVEEELIEEIVVAIPEGVGSNNISPQEEVLEVEEEHSMSFYYKRAQQREKDKDYLKAIEDYEKTISKAKKYSSEMWNSLNNSGVLKAQKLKDYKGALKDFNKIISIETNRYDGEINATRLEAGYTNRAYVKKMQGDKDGACEDLYEALGLGIESSIVFIEKQIDNNCL